MKFVMVQYPDTTVLTSLVINLVTDVGGIAGGTVVMNGSMQNPPDLTSFASATHVHAIPAESGTVAVPASTGAVTIPAAISGKPQ